MKELIKDLRRLSPSKKNTILLDTCFFIDVFEHHKEDQLDLLCKKYNVALTSFNAEELVHVDNKLSHLKHEIRKFLKYTDLKILEIPVHPGDHDGEKSYVRSVDPYLAYDVPDPSDAVLIAAAIKSKAHVLTKDKHHLFTVKLENYLNKYGLKVFKDFHEIL
jgi:predicted nucleic acid-binding protein